MMRITICKGGGDERQDPDRLEADPDRMPDDCEAKDHE